MGLRAHRKRIAIETRPSSVATPGTDNCAYSSAPRASAACARDREWMDVAISGNTTLAGVGSPWLSDDTAAAYFYGAPGTWSQPTQTVTDRGSGVGSQAAEQFKGKRIERVFTQS